MVRRGDHEPRRFRGTTSGRVYRDSFTRTTPETDDHADVLSDSPTLSQLRDKAMNQNNNAKNAANADAAKTSAFDDSTLTPAQQEELAQMRANLHRLESEAAERAARAEGAADAADAFQAGQQSAAMSTLTKVGLWTLGLGAAAAAGAFGFVYARDAGWIGEAANAVAEAA